MKKKFFYLVLLSFLMCLPLSAEDVKIENNTELIRGFIRENHEKSFIDLMKNTEIWH